jgi:hypothetical protein
LKVSEELQFGPLMNEDTFVIVASASVALIAFVLYKICKGGSGGDGNDGFPNQAWQRFINARVPVLQRQHLSTADAIPGMGASLFLCSCLFNVRTPLVLI